MNITDLIARAASGNSKIAAQRGSYLKIQLSNHGALTALVDGTATRLDVDQLIAARNMAEALRSVARLGMHYKEILTEGHMALIEIGKRTLADGKPSATPEEIAALTDLLTLHDLQLEQCTVIQMERAIKLVKDRVRSGHVSRIK